MAAVPSPARSLDPTELARARNVAAALFRIELSDAPEVLIEVLATLRTWLAGDAQASLRRSIAAWIRRLQSRELDHMVPDVARLLEEEAMGERFQRKYATWADALEDRGRQKGLQQGREEGRAEGRAEGLLLALRLVLKRQLVARFGPLPASCVALVDAAGAEDIERWIARVPEADALETVLAPP